MKNKGFTITGIFPFRTGIIWTAGDILYYNYNLYIVLSDYDGSITPDESSHCMSYVEYHSYAVQHKDDSLLTANSFGEILSEYFKGLIGGGELQNIEINSYTDLSYYEDTGAYFCHIKEDVIPTIPEGDYLLRVYKSKNDIIQEFVDYQYGLSIFRNVTKGYLTLLPSNTQDGLKKLNTNFRELTSRALNLITNLIEIKDNSFNFKKCELIDDSISNIDKNTIIHVILMDRAKSGNLQYDREFYITESTTSLTQNITGEDNLKLSYSNNKVTFTYPEIYSIQTVYISKGK